MTDGHPPVINVTEPTTPPGTIAPRTHPRPESSDACAQRSQRRRLGVLGGILAATLVLGVVVEQVGAGATGEVAVATDDVRGTSTGEATRLAPPAETVSALASVTMQVADAVVEVTTTTTTTVAPPSAPATVATTTTAPATTTTVRPTTTTTAPPTTTTTTTAPPTTTTTTTAPPTTTTTAPPAEADAGAQGGEQYAYDDPRSTQVWYDLAQCEAWGDWSINSGNGYYGGLQFSKGSWEAVGGTGYPHEHPAEVQIEMGRRLHARQGWYAWPHCARKLGLIE